MLRWTEDFALHSCFSLLAPWHLTCLSQRVTLFPPVWGMGRCFQSGSPVGRAEVAGPEETPGSLTVLETDCNCFPHRMTSSHLKLLESASLREWGGGCWTRERGKGLADENMNASFKNSICFFPHDTEKLLHLHPCLCVCVCAPVLLECIRPMTAKLLSPIFTGVVPVDTSPPSKHTKLCQWTNAWRASKKSPKVYTSASTPMSAPELSTSAFMWWMLQRNLKLCPLLPITATFRG